MNYYLYSLLKNIGMTKILVIGDVHIKTNNIIEVDILIEKLIEIAIERKPNFIVLLGDILDTFEKINTFELNKAYEMIDKLRVVSKLYILIGNHDMVNCNQFLTTNHWANGLKSWKNVEIIDTPIFEDGFLFVPYVPNGRFIEAIEKFDWKKAKCIFAHQEFYGAKMGAIISDDGDKWNLDYPYVVSGHLHMNQNPQENIYYPGSSMQVAYGETQENIVSIIDFEEGVDKYELEEIDIGLPKKKIIYTTLDGLEIPTKTKDKVKISISGDYDEFKTFKKSSKYKQIISQGMNIVFRPTRKEIKLKNEKLQERINNGCNNFLEILESSIEDINNPYIEETFELVVNNKNI